MRNGNCPYCTEPARLYPGGWFCDSHSPWAVSGYKPPVPDPNQTAKAFRERAHGPDMRSVYELPDNCVHGEPRGPAYCALCKRAARERKN